MKAFQPVSDSDLCAFVRDRERVHVRGRGSKTALHGQASESALVDLSAMRGIIEYQASEFTVTVRAGTAIADLSAALAAEGQYLPFDPLLPECGSIGGTVAANLSGPRRFRYGGVRDFILGAAVVDGLGRAYRVGGKVVKNAAGFDLSKFLVGSLGQYAIMTEVTFKVFPDVPQFRSLRFEYAALDQALGAIAFINRSVFELDALDLLPADGGWRLLARLGGFAETLPQRAERFRATMQRETAAGDAQEAEADAALWDPLTGLGGSHRVKVVVSAKGIPDLDAEIGHLSRRYSCGGNMAWVGTDDVGTLDRALRSLGLTGLCFQGESGSAVIGKPVEDVFSARVKGVLDPLGKLV